MKIYQKHSNEENFIKKEKHTISFDTLIVEGPNYFIGYCIYTGTLSLLVL